MARVFVSYSRKNKDFCRKLTDELQRRELDFWVDWEGIPPTVDWMKEIEKGIEEADTFLVIVSPDWISSKICLDELDIAVKNGKRLIPVVPCDIPWNDVPRPLAQLNFIFFTDAYDFNTQFGKLFSALDTDYAWLKTQRRLQMKALEWDRADKENGFLLRGRDLEEAEQRISINATKDPHPTDLQREYVLKSRQASDRQSRWTIAGLAFIILVMVGIIAALVTPRIQELIARNQARGELVTLQEGTALIGTADQNLQTIGAIPLQEIFVPSFLINKYEVTNRQYELCVDYGNCTVPLEQADFQDKTRQDYPVVFVTIFQANNFCRWAGLRLLTEVEWERAARGLEGSPWPWGGEFPSPQVVNMPAPETDPPENGLQPADSNPQSINPEGVHNLVGNVAEWTSSYAYLGETYENRYWDGSPGTFKGTEYYATRGGSWANTIEYISKFNPDSGIIARKDLGFRCGREVD